ncbi:hypothetical protein ACO0QE_003382 [Hanseniaspora vineae]
MASISRRYRRIALYLTIFVLLPLLLLKYVIIPLKIDSTLLKPSIPTSQQLSNFPKTAKTNKEGKHDVEGDQKSTKSAINNANLNEDKISEKKEGYLSSLTDNIRKKLTEFSLWNYDLKSTIVTDIDVISCYYSPLGEACANKDINPVTYTSDTSSYTVYKRLIKKDINQSKPYHWFGHSKYLVVSYITLEDVLNMNDKYFQAISGFNADLVNTEDNTTIKKLNLEGNQEINLVKRKISIQSIGSDFYFSDVDVLFGKDCVDPRPGWDLHKDLALGDLPLPSYFTLRKFIGESSPLTENAEKDSKEPNELEQKTKKIKQHKYFDEDVNKRLTLDANGKFKIMQIADLHFSVGSGLCRDQFPVVDKHCEADKETLEFLNIVLDREKPDLVVFTGDQIMGDECKQDAVSAILKVVKPVIDRDIPYAMIWGNHDDEGSLSRLELSEYVSTLPNSLFRFSEYDGTGKSNSFGVGNYVHQIFTPNGNAAVTLYFLDSHKYTTKPKVFPGYDWIKEEQWDYMKEYYLTKIKPSLENYSRIPLSMAFFHIPLPEYLNLSSAKNPGHQNKIVGSWKEGCTAPKYNSNGVDALVSMDVQVATCGHDHCNDYCLLDDSNEQKNIWLCYGGGSGEGGYAGYGGTERRVRVFDIDTMNGNIYSWKLLHESPDTRSDEQLLVNGGIAV